MSSTAAWILILIAVAAAAVIGYYAGRHTAPGKRQVDSLQKELEEHRQSMQQYRESVNHHFEKTATLFTNMAGSYRELYDHLRESYGQLTDSPGRPLLPERAGALLEGERPRSTGREPASAREPAEPSPQREPAAPPPGTESESEDMLGDAPHIPERVDLEEPPEEPVKALREDDAERRTDSGVDTPQEKTSEADRKTQDSQPVDDLAPDSAGTGTQSDTRRS